MLKFYKGTVKEKDFAVYQDDWRVAECNSLPEAMRIASKLVDELQENGENAVITIDMRFVDELGDILARETVMRVNLRRVEMLNKVEEIR